jgi:hypothetical protein
MWTFQQMEALEFEREALQAKIDALNITDYCTSPSPRERECVVEFDALESNFRYVCEKNGGHYTETFYKVDCQGGRTKYVLSASNEPGCASTSNCDADERTIMLKVMVGERIKQRLETSDSMTCQISYFRVREFEVMTNGDEILPLEQRIQTDAPSLLPTPPPAELLTSAPTTNDVPEDDASLTDVPSKAFKGANVLLALVLSIGSLLFLLLQVAV